MIFNTKLISGSKALRKATEKHIAAGDNVEQKKVPIKRSTDANALYWLWLQVLQDETGEKKEQFHKYFKSEHIGTTEEEVFGRLITLEPTTTNKSKRFFWEYMQNVKADAATEFGVMLPLPTDNGFEEFYNKYSEYL